MAEVNDGSDGAPFLLQIFCRHGQQYSPYEFNPSPNQADRAHISDASSLLVPALQREGLQVFTTLDCSLGDLSALLTDAHPQASAVVVGTRIVFTLMYTEALQRHGHGEDAGRWVNRALGSVVVGGRDAYLPNNIAEVPDDADDDALKTLKDARFVVGDYICCTILAPSKDGEVAPVPPPRSAPRRDSYGHRGSVSNGSQSYRGSDRESGGFRGGYRGTNSGRDFGPRVPPPVGDWKRGEMPPGPRGYSDDFGGRGRDRW